MPHACGVKPRSRRKKFGDRIYANMIMLGALVKATRIVSEKPLKSLADSVEKENIAINRKAYLEGITLI